MTSPNNKPGAEDPEASKDLRTPSHSGQSGGTTATDIGSRDEEKTVSGGEPEPTRVTKQDKVQPDTGTRSDHESSRN